MKKKFLLALMIVLALGILFIGCDDDVDDDDWPRVTECPDPGAHTPKPEPPAPPILEGIELLGLKDFIGNWILVDTEASYTGAEDLYAYVNRVTGQSLDTYRYSEEKKTMARVAFTHKALTIEIDKYGKLKLTVNTTLTATNVKDKWGVIGFREDRWQEAIDYIRAAWGYTNVSANYDQHKISANLVIERNLSLVQAKALVENLEFSLDKKNVTITAAGLQELFHFLAFDSEIAFVSDLYLPPDPADCKIPTLADLEGEWYSENGRPIETVREFLERKESWKSTASVLGDMGMTGTQKIELTIDATGHVSRHIWTTLIALPKSDGTYPGMYTTFRKELVNGWPKPCIPEYDDAAHTVTGWDDTEAQLDLAALTAGETGVGMRISKDGKKLWVPGPAQTWPQKQAAGADFAPNVATQFYELGYPGGVFIRQ
jgi:hypothetical protein